MAAEWRSNIECWEVLATSLFTYGACTYFLDLDADKCIVWSRWNHV